MEDSEIAGFARGATGQRSDPCAAGAPRKELAARYISGAGVEFGALHSPLCLPEGVSVKYADLHPVETLRKLFPDVAGIRPPDIITDLESMRGLDDLSQHFVIANHVLEHVEDPLRALKSISRVLQVSGIAFLALPDKRFTFDKDRKITSLDHLLRDHREGPDRSLRDHYEEWCRCVDGLEGDEHTQKVALMLEQRTNIHFHVWDYDAMSELFAHVRRNSEFNLELVTSAANGNEVVWILEKPKPRSTAVAAQPQLSKPTRAPGRRSW